jgi:hypothetical protein
MKTVPVEEVVEEDPKDKKRGAPPAKSIWENFEV